MKILFLAFFVGSLFASELPKELTDDHLKVKSIELMRSHLKNGFYQIDELLVKRVRSGDTNFAVAINNIWENSGKCFSYLIVADSTKCTQIQNCKLAPMVVDCSQRSEVFNQLLNNQY